jgi:hypothetical protein
LVPDRILRVGDGRRLTIGFSRRVRDHRRRTREGAIDEPKEQIAPEYRNNLHSPVDVVVGVEADDDLSD